ncbi:hypothetical protein B0T18DRAFT_22343 [Schizothecium vesticola]|uniref:C2H2-type domain-containing protein n=1 Tax=Schizothecium vesticola TaxID=314040 RepID=A0AA40KCI8_9PEZI|nr:hypothetical protein B0T18DRAFT_22343 [Schizothecium vesticola]
MITNPTVMITMTTPAISSGSPVHSTSITRKKYRKERTCVGPGFDKIHRVKEHLVRKHSEPPNMCPRCHKPNETPPDLLRRHQTKHLSCEVVPEADRPDRMTAAQKTKMWSRKKRNETEEDQSARMYQILFGCGDNDVPSPSPVSVR